MTPVLLLNASYEPLSVITHQRAVSLLLRERVEPATDQILPIRGVTSIFHLPTVVRLRRYIQIPRHGITWSKKAVLQRDGYCCIYCGVRPGDWQGNVRLSRREFTVDHILPRSRGGGDTWHNTACACQTCNQHKGNRTPEEAGMPLLWQPDVPRVNRLYALGELPEAWKDYL
ncbi:MAG: HNH endonuclease [Anaerolineales bacterium]|nr:HNH endonuclease [Anaerolineales bacterium]